MPKGRPIIFLSDYGLEDEFVGICHAVIARISPASPVIDLTHAIPPQDVLRGALVLGRSIRYLPIDAVILAVVDPGVGTPRRPVAVETSQGGQLLVGPDNGLLSLTWAERGGVARAVEITEPEVDRASLVEVHMPAAGVEVGRIDAEVFGVDRFGNVQLSAGVDDLERAGLAGAIRLEAVTRGVTR